MDTMRQKKIVVFHPAIAPYRIDLFNRIDEAFEAVFYFEFGDALEQSFEQARLRERLRFTPRFLRPGLWGIKNLRTEVFPILRRERPDAVLCSEFNLLGLLLILYKIVFDRRLRILTICDDSREIASHAGFVKRLTRGLLARAFDGAILVNDEVAEWYGRRFGRREKFLSFPIIQDDAIFRAKLSDAFPETRALAERYKLRGRRVALFVGRLVPLKNLTLLIEAMAGVADRFPDAVLLLVGEGEQRPLLEARIRDLELADRVIFAGKKEGAALYAHYGLGQVFVLPSLYERFGAVVNEALMAGCYTLCSSVAGASCLIEPGVNGAIFDPSDRAGLTRELSRAMEACEPLAEATLKPDRMPRAFEAYWEDLLRGIRRILDERGGDAA